MLEHAEITNELKAIGIRVGLLINFGAPKLNLNDSSTDRLSLNLMNCSPLLIQLALSVFHPCSIR